MENITRYFEVGFEDDGIYSVNIITADTGDNDLEAVRETAERHAGRYGYRVAYVNEKPEWYADEHKRKGMPVYPIDEEARRKYTMGEDDAQETTDDYFIVNQETGKLELHFDKATYQALSEDAKRTIKSHFLWGRRSGCWISRCKEPNLYGARRVAQELGLTDAGKTGERLSFAEQMERKAERAERRAERYDARSEAAEKRGQVLQKPINDMHGDIAFFTQPNINTSGGRAFTRRREKMFAAFERGFEEFRKSAYWQERAETARRTAGQAELKDKGFIGRRIAERESDIRKLRKSIEEYESFIPALEKGETPRDHYGWEVRLSLEQVQGQIELWLDRLEVKLDELGFYQECMNSLGGVTFSKANLNKGDLLYINRCKEPVRFLRGGPKNFTYEFTLPHMKYANGDPMQGQAAYAEIRGRAE